MSAPDRIFMFHDEARHYQYEEDGMEEAIEAGEMSVYHLAPANKKMREGFVGRAACTPGEYALLADTVLRSQGSYIEFGVLFGASLCIAGEAMQQRKDRGDVIGVDPLDSYYGGSDPSGVTSSPEIVAKNCDLYGVVPHIIRLHTSDVHPDNVLTMFGNIGVAMVDACHDAESVRLDLVLANRLEPEYILVHDYGNPEHPGVSKGLHWWLGEAYETTFEFDIRKDSLVRLKKHGS
jgi:hypothetical protein